MTTRQVGVWQTPHGHQAVMHYRADTSDWNTISSVMAPHDEYELPAGLSGLALDVGAHVGSVAVALALDNPSLRVVAVEPVPPNVDLLRLNVAANGLEDRIVVMAGAAGLSGAVDVWWGYSGTEAAEHHAYIGNSSIAYANGGSVTHETTTYPQPVTLTELTHDGPVAWLKIDCEGGEWDFLRSPSLGLVDFIVGEFHPVRDHCREDLLPILSRTHAVTFPPVPEGVDPRYGPGHFIAVRR